MNKTKILVIGATGMLGNAVITELSNNETFEVFGAARDSSLLIDFVKTNNLNVKTTPSLDVLNENNWLFNELKNPAGFVKYDYIINCVGVIKPFMSQSIIDAIKINSLFPHQLAKMCSEKCKMIHISTDCAYSGFKGNYIESDVHDCLDDYGKSKSLGEPVNDCMIIRTSIIGKEIHKNASLLAWAISQKGKEVNGFTNHFWNGITTNEYGKIVSQIITKQLYKKELFHIHSTSVSKLEMLQEFNKKFDLNLTIKPTEAKVPCDRTLSSTKKLIVQLDINSFEKMVELL